MCPPVDSPDQWWRLDVQSEFIGQMIAWEEKHGAGEWTFAVHGTSLRSTHLIFTKGFEYDWYETKGISGVFVESMSLMQCSLNCATHANDWPLPRHMAA